MVRSFVAVVVVVFLACPVASGQQDGGTGTGGTDTGGTNTGGTGGAANTDADTGLSGERTTTSDTGGRGLDVPGGITEQTTSAFDAVDNRAFSTVGGGNSGRGQTRSFTTGGQGNRGNTTGGTSSTARQVKPRFRLGFVPSQLLTPSRLQSRAASRFVGITPRIRSLQSVAVTAGQNGQLTLRGQATSRYGRLLAAAIARLEPGVRSVRNEVSVTSSPQTRPAASVPADPVLTTPAPIGGAAQPPSPVAPPLSPRG